jgi:hypothetical protein
MRKAREKSPFAKKGGRLSCIIYHDAIRQEAGVRGGCVARKRAKNG